VDPDVIDVPLDDLIRNDETLRAEYLIQPRGDEARAKVASLALKVIGVRAGGATFLDDDDVEAPIETSGFPKQMDGEERTGRPAADDGHTIAVLEAQGRTCHHGTPRLDPMYGSENESRQQIPGIIPTRVPTSAIIVH